MKKILLILLLSIGFVGQSYAVEKTVNISDPIEINWRAEERWTCNEGYIRYENRCYKEGDFSPPFEIATFPNKKAVQLKKNAEAKLAAQEMMAEIESAQTEALAEKKKAQAEIEAALEAWAQVWVADIATKVKSYWNYSGADDDWSCNVMVHQNVNGKVLTVNIQDCNTGSSDNALMADDKVRAFMNSIERAVYKASPLPIAPHEDMFDRQILFRFSAN